MKKQVYEIDNNGFLKEVYVAEVNENGEVLESDKAHFISHIMPHGLIKPKWIGTEWIEGVTQEEIDELTKVEPALPTQEDFMLDLEFRVTMLEMGL